MGEVIIEEDRIIIPFKGSKEIKVIGWDSNELSLDSYEPSMGFIHVDLRHLQSVKIVYKGKKAVEQSKDKEEFYERYVARERNRIRDFRNKPVASLKRLLLSSVHVFEDLDKGDMVSRTVLGKGLRGAHIQMP